MIYTLVELQTHNFDDKEIISLFENQNLVKNCILVMFHFIGIEKTFNDVSELIKHDDWMNKFNWTWQEHDSFIKELCKVYKNIYQYSLEKSYWVAENFVYKYGFLVKDNKKNERKHFKNLLKCKY